jgi:hypothetical protein
MNPKDETDHAASEGRDSNGRFAKGNQGGPGNPFARKVAELRQALVNFVTEDDMKHVAFILKEKAMGGDLAAIKLLFQYVLGKPQPAPDPDRLDVDEWQKTQEQSRPPEEMSKVMNGMPAALANRLTQITWPCVVKSQVGEPMLAELHEMDKRDARRQARAEERARRKAARRGDGPKPNGANGHPEAAGDELGPKPNGSNGGHDPADWLAHLFREALASRNGS